MQTASVNSRALELFLRLRTEAKKCSGHCDAVDIMSKKTQAVLNVKDAAACISAVPTAGRKCCRPNGTECLVQMLLAAVFGDSAVKRDRQTLMLTWLKCPCEEVTAEASALTGLRPRGAGMLSQHRVKHI